ncbi:hypothetical protein M885DRAFT_530087 [Pelagophyceae sp. CCMP2097]|nr:hypothetical protein M885DRAFT_530087 [Pelagophyceae sp. CCMP2097]
MGGKKLDKIKELQKKDKNIVVDKTFGLKNKGKSKKVQTFVSQVQSQSNHDKGRAEELRSQKKAQKSAAIEAEMEMRSLFSEGLSITVHRGDLRKKKVTEGIGAAAGGGGGGHGASDHYDSQWAEAELEKAGANLVVEDRIEKARAEFKASGVVGTPVTLATFTAWKAAKLEKKLDAKRALIKAEQLKKKGGKGLSILSGRDLYLMQKDLFVDDADAADDYARDAADEDEVYDEHGRRLDDGDADATADAANASADDAGFAAVDASLYLDDDDLDDDDLDEPEVPPPAKAPAAAVKPAAALVKAPVKAPAAAPAKAQPVAAKSPAPPAPPAAATVAAKAPPSAPVAPVVVVPKPVVKLISKADAAEAKAKAAKASAKAAALKAAYAVTKTPAAAVAKAAANDAAAKTLAAASAATTKAASDKKAATQAAKVLAKTKADAADAALAQADAAAAQARAAAAKSAPVKAVVGADVVAAVNQSLYLDDDADLDGLDDLDDLDD